VNDERALPAPSDDDGETSEGGVTELEDPADDILGMMLGSAELGTSARFARRGHAEAIRRLARGGAGADLAGWR
jgi:beta-glucanase (GH16 family)